MLPYKQILQDMLVNKMRLCLTVLAVAWATFAIAVMLSFGEGLRLTFAHAMENMGSGSLLVTGQQSSVSYQGQSQGIKIILSQEDLDLITRTLNDKALVSAEAEWRAHMYYGDLSRHSNLTVVGPNYSRVRGIAILPGGRFINDEDIKQRRKVIVLGAKTAEKLFHKKDAVGESVLINATKFLVVGVQRKNLQLFSQSHIPLEYTNWIPSSTYHILNNKRDYTTFIIAPQKLQDIEGMKKEISTIIAYRRHLDPNDPALVNFVDLQKEKQKLNVFLYGLEIMLGIIGSLTLVVAGVGITNVMYMSVKRATRDIGLRMAIGAQPSDILIYYATESLMTTFLGGILGLILAYGAVFFLQNIPVHSDVLDYMGNPKPMLSFAVIVITILILGIIGFLAGFFPARKAALIHPAEALRYEK